MDYLKTLKSILSKRTDISNVKNDTLLTSLGLDSLDLVEIMLEIEDTLHIEFTSDEIINLTTVQSVIDLINQKMK